MCDKLNGLNDVPTSYSYFSTCIYYWVGRLILRFAAIEIRRSTAAMMHAHAYHLRIHDSDVTTHNNNYYNKI